MTSNDRFEIKATLFFRDTGFMAPGKDMPLGMNTSNAVRYAAWNTWRYCHEALIDKVLDQVNYHFGITEPEE